MPPTINLDNPDLEAGCGLDYVPNVAHRYLPDEIPTGILSDNLGFGETLLTDNSVPASRMHFSLGGHKVAIALKTYIYFFAAAITLLKEK